MPSLSSFALLCQREYDERQAMAADAQARGAHLPGEPTIGIDDAIRNVEAAARRCAYRTLKACAALFVRTPIAMESVFPGLAISSPERIIKTGEHLLEQARLHPTRDFGSVKATNAKAVILAGRFLRRFERLLNVA